MSHGRCAPPHTTAEAGLQANDRDNFFHVARLSRGASLVQHRIGASLRHTTTIELRHETTLSGHTDESACHQLRLAALRA